ncbi:MerR family transcriptional regulator [Proteobacteria bacterium 005FR1]|nr:MerR family transcriptional regulator [Proteobacteria bacterium 005FR1]
MKIGELAKAAEVSKDTIRHYLDMGLLQAEKDPGNGYQVFSPEAVSRLRFIKQAQQLGFRLDDIARIFEDAQDAQSPCPRVRDIIVERIRETRQQIAELTRLCDNMEKAVGSWEEMPNQMPNGQSICRLIESQTNSKSTAPARTAIACDGGDQLLCLQE